MEKFKTSVVIIGAGLFGSMISKYLKSRGIDCLIVDRNDIMNASKCSSGIFRPGWAGKIQPEVSVSLPIIEKFVSIVPLPIFDGDKEIQTTIDFIDCNLILNEEFLAGDVVRCTKDKTAIRSVIVDVEGVEVEIECDHLVVAAGSYTNTLLAKLGIPTVFQLDSYWGAVVHTSDLPKRNYIQTWAPYKQMYGLTLERGGKNVGYFTMGTAVKNPPVGGDNRTLAGGGKLVQYAAAACHMKQIIEIPEGLRPFFAEKGGEVDFVNNHGLNVISATGGAKNSTLLCGYAAKRVFEEITGKKS